MKKRDLEVVLINCLLDKGTEFIGSSVGEVNGLLFSKKLLGDWRVLLYFRYIRSARSFDPSVGIVNTICNEYLLESAARMLDVANCPIDNGSVSFDYPSGIFVSPRRILGWPLLAMPAASVAELIGSVDCVFSEVVDGFFGSVVGSENYLNRLLDGMGEFHWALSNNAYRLAVVAYFAMCEGYDRARLIECLKDKRNLVERDLIPGVSMERALGILCPLLR